MAEADWAYLTGGLPDSQVRRGATTAITPPNGGGTFTFGFRSIQAVEGAAGLYTIITGFNPLSAGGRISGAIQRAAGTGALNYGPLLYIGLQGPTIDDLGYLLGFASDEDPAHLILRKGKPSEGIQSDSSDILRQSTNTYATGTWYQFQMDMIVQPAGDVDLEIKENDLGSNPVGSPVWGPINGMAEFTDDTLGHNSGSPPYVNGYVGFAAYIGGDAGRPVFFDHLVVGDQI